jgi:site-specific recombinase XerD
MTELRNKMIRAMELQNLSQNSQKSYLNAVSGLAKYYRQSPDQLTKEMIEDYLLYLKKEKHSALTTVGSVITGLRFFYNHVIGDQQLAPSCKFAKTPSKLPSVLSQEEIFSIINATDNLKHRLLLMTTYSAGLRASEVLSLKPEDIDSKRMLIKVTGKGDKQRYTLLAQRLLPELRHYFKMCRPKPHPKRANHFAMKPSDRSTKRPEKKPASKTVPASIPCVIRSPHTCWKPAMTFETPP